MGLLDICSYKSLWRGLDYYEAKVVKKLRQINNFEYEAEVEGTKLYKVHLNIKNPRKSTCNCPHADGKSIICKHKVAVYFSLFKDEAKAYIKERSDYFKEQEKLRREYERRVNEEKKIITKYVTTLSEKQVREMLVNYMLVEAMSSDEYLDEDDYFDEYDFY